MMAGKRTRADKKEANEDIKRGRVDPEEAKLRAAADAQAEGTVRNGSKRKRTESTSEEEKSDDGDGEMSEGEDGKSSLSSTPRSKSKGGSTKKAAKAKSKAEKRVAKVAKKTSTTDDMPLPTAEDIEEKLDEFMALARAEIARLASIGQQYRLSKHDHEYRKYLVGSLFKELGSKKCMNCGAFSPSLRRDGHAKIFKLPLNDKQKKSNWMTQCRIVDVLGPGGGFHDVVAEAEALMNNKEARAREQKEARKKGIEVKKQKKNLGLGESKDAGVDEWEGEQDIRARDIESLAAASEAALAAGPSKKEGASLLFPNEVEKHMELLWATEKDLVRTVWGGLAHLSHMVTPLAQADYRMFFLRVLAVPPPKFRQTSKHQKKVFDHPQNAYFKRILEHDIAIINANIAKVYFHYKHT
jgi:hypothetical protein